MLLERICELLEVQGPSTIFQIAEYSGIPVQDIVAELRQNLDLYTRHGDKINGFDLSKAKQKLIEQGRLYYRNACDSKGIRYPSVRLMIRDNSAFRAQIGPYWDDLVKDFEITEYGYSSTAYYVDEVDEPMLKSLGLFSEEDDHITIVWSKLRRPHDPLA